ncbi:prepilin-type N-terminal cleavage/methylation domain-containing protein [Demequina capsici]|uniref:Prepilin-type N-terminal cleavage/methylation domain-containing protein n=1 Tax=Demequina capsici TaxID=3075620 RepID=A0AA96F6A0_9MICO|nr:MULTISPECIES: prepilin-type N-terminal cleavage/methylation domain-containing protein [unclassified Demequina]WNM24618.1 prepilin-type N-terminal cleavage/methylation domain-containing protein [Demequina sp. OYTSA14]WNM27467.1 prepilin-type N-terminal cleavage/methylation domain-containing protein [Demequina sp. PMTSA13]
MRTFATRRNADGGFSLVELLVTMVIIAILVGIGIPIFLNQRTKAADTATRSDAVNLGLAIHTENEPIPVVKVERRTDGYYIDDKFAMPASKGVQLVTFTTTGLHWCIQLSHPQGAVAKSPGIRYDSERGLEDGLACG